MFKALILFAVLLFSTMASVLPKSTTARASLQKRVLREWHPSSNEGYNASRAFSVCDHNSITYSLDSITNTQHNASYPYMLAPH